MDNQSLETAQFSIEEIQGLKVNPVERRIFENRKGRARRIFGLGVWFVAISVTAFAAVALLGLIQAS